MTTALKAKDRSSSMTTTEAGLKVSNFFAPLCDMIDSLTNGNEITEKESLKGAAEAMEEEACHARPNSELWAGRESPKSGVNIKGNAGDDDGMLGGVLLHRTADSGCYMDSDSSKTETDLSHDDFGRQSIAGNTTSPDITLKTRIPTGSGNSSADLMGFGRPSISLEKTREVNVQGRRPVLLKSQRSDSSSEDFNRPEQARFWSQVVTATNKADTRAAEAKEPKLSMEEQLQMHVATLRSVEEQTARKMGPWGLPEDLIDIYEDSAESSVANDWSDADDESEIQLSSG